MSWRFLRPLSEGEEVLLGGGQGGVDGAKVYFGVVVEVDHEEGQCLVRFGDCTEQWSAINDVRRLDCEPDQDDNDDDSQSHLDRSSGHGHEDVLLDEDSDLPPDLGPPEVDLSARNRRREHREAYEALDESDEEAEIGDDDDDDEAQEYDVDEEDVPLRSFKKRKRKKNSAKSSSSAPAAKQPRRQSAAGTASSLEAAGQKRFRGARKPSRKTEVAPLVPRPVPQRVLEARKELPYDFDSLTWDASHQRNAEERYCYCGESGDWYKKMLQCWDCLQWFHRECLRVPASSAASTGDMLFGDRFFQFSCALCTGQRDETLRRLDPSWIEALHLVLFNLTVVNNKKYHDLETSVVPFFRRKWKCLQGPSCRLKSSRVEVGFLTDLLVRNKTRFKCGSEIKKRSTFWGLRKVAPPSVPGRLASGGATFPSSSTPPTVGFASTNGDSVGAAATCSSSSSSTSSGAAVNYKSKMESKQHQRLRRQLIAAAAASVKIPLSKKPSSMPHPSSTTPLLKPPVAKKRGRPPRQKQQLLRRQDSVELSAAESDGATTGTSLGESSSVSTSGPAATGTLDAFIPPPKDFEGFNNPFRTLGISTSASASTSAPATSSETSPGCSEPKGLLLMVHDPAKGLPKSLLGPKKETSAASSETGEGGKPSVHSADIKSYFGGMNRLLRGDRFNVAARRLNMDGDVQYLVDWDQPNPLSPPTPLTSPVKREEHNSPEKRDSPVRVKLEERSEKRPSPLPPPKPIVIKIRSPVKEDVKVSPTKSPSRPPLGPASPRKSPNVAKKSASVVPPPAKSPVRPVPPSEERESVIEIFPLKGIISTTAAEEKEGDDVGSAEVKSPSEDSLRDRIKDFKCSLEKVQKTITARTLSTSSSSSLAAAAEKPDDPAAVEPTEKEEDVSEKVEGEVPDKMKDSTPVVEEEPSAKLAEKNAEEDKTKCDDQMADKTTNEVTSKVPDDGVAKTNAGKAEEKITISVTEERIAVVENPKAAQEEPTTTSGVSDAHPTEKAEEAAGSEVSPVGTGSSDGDAAKCGGPKCDSDAVEVNPRASEAAVPIVDETEEKGRSESDEKAVDVSEADPTLTGSEKEVEGATSGPAEEGDVPSESQMPAVSADPSGTVESQVETTQGAEAPLPEDPAEKLSEEASLPPVEEKTPSSETTCSSPVVSIPTVVFYSQAAARKKEAPSLRAASCSILTLEKVPEQLPDDILAGSPAPPDEEEEDEATEADCTEDESVAQAAEASPKESKTDDAEDEAECGGMDRGDVVQTGEEKMARVSSDCESSAKAEEVAAAVVLTTDGGAPRRKEESPKSEDSQAKSGLVVAAAEAAEPQKTGADSVEDEVEIVEVRNGPVASKEDGKKEESKDSGETAPPVKSNLVKPSSNGLTTSGGTVASRATSVTAKPKGAEHAKEESPSSSELRRKLEDLQRKLDKYQTKPAAVLSQGSGATKKKRSASGDSQWNVVAAKKAVTTSASSSNGLPSASNGDASPSAAAPPPPRGPVVQPNKTALLKVLRQQREKDGELVLKATAAAAAKEKKTPVILMQLCKKTSPS